MPKFLHVGCGNDSKEQTTRGFAKAEWDEIRYDIDENINPDIVGSITSMEPIPSNSFDAIYSSHNIEHLYAHEVPLAISEFYRVIKPDGFVVITCPDLQSVCTLVAEDKLTEPAYQSSLGPITPLDILYGHRKAIASGNVYMAHHCGFTKRVLAGVFQQAGFQGIAVRNRPKYFDLWGLGIKAANQKERIQELIEQHFPE